MSISRAKAISAFVVASCLVGCARGSVAYSTTTVTSAPPFAPTPEEGTFEPSSIALYVTESLLPSVCGTQPSLALAPARFAVGLAEVPMDATIGLRELARCLTTGPLATTPVRLVGQTQPRESPSPLDLGLARAIRVKQTLMELGVEGARINVATEGDTRSRTLDPETWPDARRVDVLIARPPLFP